ncbi:SEL1-like repeat protein [Helicobacter didelphidarum]|nr:sel1 repeat family protein [Helicobacter didelphidarum]
MKKSFVIILLCCIFQILYAKQEIYEDLIGYVYRHANPELAREYYANATTQWEYNQPEAAVQRYKMSCDLGLGTACAKLADIYENGLKGIPTNVKYAETFSALACALGDLPSCEKLK